MSYPQYTKAVEASNYFPLNQYVQLALAALLGGGVAALLVAAANYYTDAVSWVCWVLVGEITASAGVLAYCNWWLNDRLIALPADPNATDGPAVDKTVIGMIVSIEPPGSEPFPGNYDTDYCFNLLLYNNPPGVVTDNANPPFGSLMKEQRAISNLPGIYNLGFTGTQASYFLPGYYDGSSEAYRDGGTTVTSSVLHAEIEGAGVADLQKTTQIAFGLEIAGLAACLALSNLGPFSEAAAALLALLAFLIGLLGGIFAPGDQASPQDITPPPGGPLQAPDQQGLNASVVMVTGTWVYDSAHSGWNELHPVKAIQYLSSWQGGWGATLPAAVATRYVQMQQAATAPETQQNQQEPQQQWHVHPLIDGCGEYPPILPPDGPPTRPIS